MGITIHYQLRLRDENALHGLIATVRAYADAHGWPVRDITLADAVLPRSNDAGDWEYTGPSSGIEVLPDEYSDPVRFAFGSDLLASDFTKTQFAGPDVHRQVIHLLDALSGFLSELQVVDEGEYWERRDPEALARSISTCGDMIRDAIATHPNARGPVRLASGRWADVIT